MSTNQPGRRRDPRRSYLQIPSLSYHHGQQLISGCSLSMCLQYWKLRILDSQKLCTMPGHCLQAVIPRLAIEYLAVAHGH